MCARYSIQQNKKGECKDCSREDNSIFSQRKHSDGLKKRTCDKRELFKKNAEVQETPVDRCSFPGILTKLKDMEKDLQKTFPLWGRDVEQVMKS